MSFTLTMPRFHQTVLPLEKMMKVWVKLSVAFAIVTFVETLVEIPELQERYFSDIYDAVLVYKNSSYTASDEVSTISKLMQNHPYVVELIMLFTMYYRSAVRSMVTIILPYYFTTYIIGLYA